MKGTRQAEVDWQAEAISKGIVRAVGKILLYAFLILLALGIIGSLL